ncbi:MAG: hypothetical protein WDZ35_06360 [Crocinitomicaceae bacterium]
MKEIKCRISRIRQLSNEVLYIDIDPQQQFSLNDFNELKKAALQLGEGKSFYNIINVGENTLPDKAAREMSCSLAGSYYKKADAFIIHSLAQKIMGNLMIRIHKPAVPTQFFKSKDAAEKWLNSLRKKEKVVAI